MMQRCEATHKSLTELRDANLPRLAGKQLLKVKGELTADEWQAIDTYFADFLPPGPCVSCGSELGSEDTIAALLDPGTFTWGIVNGEGNCSKCGYPARGLHRNVGPIEFMELILQYHPLVLTE